MQHIKYDPVLKKYRENDAASVYVDNTVAEGSTAPVSGAAVYRALATKQPLITPLNKLPASLVDGEISASATWGDIKGDISSQEDLADELASRLKLTGGTLTGSVTISGNGNSLTLQGTSTSLYLYQTGNIRGGYHVAIGGTYGCLGIGYEVNKGQVEQPGRGCAGIGDNIYVHEDTQFVHGKFNTTKSGARIVGGGSGTSARKNIEELSWQGDHFIAGGYSQEETAIPAATSSYTISRRGEYTHIPASPPQYTLATPAESGRTFDVTVTVRFSASAMSCEFLDSNGATIVPLSQPQIADGSVVAYLCRWQPLLGAWAIMAVPMGTYSGQ